jgi:hypothetical protein
MRRLSRFVFLLTLVAASRFASASTLSVTISGQTTDGNYGMAHIFIDEITGDSVPVTVFFDPQTLNVLTAEVYTNLNRRDKATVTWAKHTFNVSAVEQNATRSGNSNLIVDSTADAMRGSNITVTNAGAYNGNYRVVSVPASNKIEIAHAFGGSATGQVTLNYEEGIVPFDGGQLVAGDDTHYYKSYTMSSIPTGYTLTLNAQKTGAYRVTARYQLTTDPDPKPWHYFNDFTPAGSPYPNRDFALVVSPMIARTMTMAEIDPINVNATGSNQDGSQRGTIAALAGTNANRWNFTYAQALGVNWFWLQPIHPFGIDGRQLSAADINNRTPGANETTYVYNGGAWYQDVNYAFALGSPYAVKNFFEIEPRLTVNGSSRDAAKTEFYNMVQAADSAGVSIMLDAAFNHSSYDAEFGDLGTQLFVPDTSATKTDLIRNFEVRLYSRSGEYDERANYYNQNSNPNSPDTNIAVAPDRYDFGKFIDTEDFYFGRYAALVPNAGSSGNYTSEADWFDYSVGDENTAGSNSGHFDTITQNMWHYFGQYVPYWLSQTGYGGHNSTPADGDYATRLALDRKGIDGLRADFGQGLPPQEWEYIINVARSVKWTMVFMAESLDGGNVGYRSARHFDILNENIIFALKTSPITADALRGIYDARRTSYGQALILLNTVSHDEDNYNDPWQAVVRYASGATIDGVPMVFPGQELGIVTDPSGNGGAGYNFGYDLFERNFGKWIPHFKTYNSMMPLYNNVDPANPTYNFGNAQLKPVYAGINQARQFSAALRSSNRYYLNQTGSNSPQESIFSVAKYETANASPGKSDVEFAFVNLDRSNAQSGNYNVNITQNGSNLFGINATRTYNVKNIAAYNPSHRNDWLWGANGISGSTILSGGVFVSLNPVPSTNAAWTSNPYEAQFVKLYDISAPNTPSPSPQISNAYGYAIGNSVTFNWSADPNLNPSYTVTVTVNGGAPFTVTTTGTSYTYTGNYGDQVTITVTATNQDFSAQSGTSSGASVKLLDPNGDADGDGMTNAQEDIAGTDPLNPNSVFRITNVTPTSVTWSTVQGRTYQLFKSSSPGGPYSTVGSPYTETTTGNHTQTVSDPAPMFYRAQVSQ